MFERPGVLAVGDQVVFDGTVQTVVAISGTKIRLLSEAGQASVVALPFLLSAEDFELVGSGPAVPKIEPRGLLDALPDKVLAAATDWERHVVEVETGVPPDAPAGTEPRPGYDPVTQSMAAREKAAAGEPTRKAELSTSEAPTLWPRPVRSRSRKAARTATTPKVAPMISTTEAPARKGWPGGPVM